MPSEASQQWRQRASGFFSSSGVRLKSAGRFVGDVAKDAGENVAGVAGRVGSMVKGRWGFVQQQRGQRQQGKGLDSDAIQERFLSAAASTGVLLKKGIAETKEKVVVGKLKVEEAAKKTADRSKSIFNNIERWQKGVASTDVFGVPIELTVQHQESTKPVPLVLIRCAENLIMSGLSTEYLFKREGDVKIMLQLVSLYNGDCNASLPEGVSPVEVAALIKCYLASLPEPLATFELFHEIRNARSNITTLRDILKKLPNVNYMTLEYVTALLLRVSQKSLLNKMDAYSLALEFAPVIMCQKGDQRTDFRSYLGYTSMKNSRSNLAPNDHGLESFDFLDDDEDDVSSQIPLDDGPSPDYGAIEVIQCLIEHHNAVFTDANETVWRFENL